MRAADTYDLPISLNKSQSIVWALGHLNERKEVSYHTKYTDRNHIIDFGRQPRWNCPMPEGIKTETISEELFDTIEEIEQPSRGSEVHNYQSFKEEFYENQSEALHQTNNRTKKPPHFRPYSELSSKSSSTIRAWDIPPIQCYEPEDGVFYAQMGPTGGKYGYPAITGKF